MFNYIAMLHDLSELYFSISVGYKLFYRPLLAVIEMQSDIGFGLSPNLLIVETQICGKYDGKTVTIILKGLLINGYRQEIIAKLR